MAKARALLADKVGGDPGGLNGTGVAVHNLVASVKLMRAAVGEPARAPPAVAEAAAAQCLVAPEQVVRQA